MFVRGMMTSTAFREKMTMPGKIIVDGVTSLASSPCPVGDRWCLCRGL
jgi:hypothetical protein